MAENNLSLTISTPEPTTSFLYKYRHIDENNKDFIADIFTNNKIFFASPSSFNDPFDCQARLSFDAPLRLQRSYLDSLLKKRSPHLTRNERRTKIKNGLPSILGDNFSKATLREILGDVGVFCLSEVRDNILMWSHYANGHTGFCLEFIATSDTPIFGGALKVRYDIQKPILQYFIDDRLVQIEKALFTKSQDWSYEKEWRIIDHEHGAGVRSFNAEHLTGVILGCRMLESTKRQIIEWVLARKSKMKIYESVINEQKYTLDIVNTAHK